MSRYYQVYKYQGNVYDGRYLTANSDGSLRWTLTRGDAHKLTKAEAKKMAAHVERIFIGHHALVVPDNRDPWKLVTKQNPSKTALPLWRVIGTGRSGGAARIQVRAADHAEAMRIAKSRKMAVTSCVLVTKRGKNPSVARRGNPAQRYQIAKKHPRQSIVLWYTGVGFSFSPHRSDAVSYAGKESARAHGVGIADRTGSKVAVVPESASTLSVVAHLLGKQ